MILKLGSTGLDVRTLQAALRALDLYKPPAAIDGAFGPKTELAVKAFQLANGLTVDGVVGPVTWTALLAPASRAPYPIPRCWPLKCLPDGRKPQITSGHKARNGERSNHNGVDIMYPYRLSDPPMKVGDGGRAKNWWIPKDTFAIAPFAGEIVLADDSPTGKRAWLRHPSGWNAGFFHMDEFACAVGWSVNMGATIGRVADSPRPGSDDPDHLHFELYWGDIVSDVKHGKYARGSVDPELMLSLTPFLP